MQDAMQQIITKDIERYSKRFYKPGHILAVEAVLFQNIFKFCLFFPFFCPFSEKIASLPLPSKIGPTNISKKIQNLFVKINAWLGTNSKRKKIIKRSGP